MAMYSIKGMGWFAVGVVVALGCYTASNRVAAERDRLASIERSIEQAKGDLRMLNAEFATRANIAQLERWNGDVMRLSAPRVGQIVDGDVALASLHGDAAGVAVQSADYVVPSGVDPDAMRSARADGTVKAAAAPDAAGHDAAATAVASRAPLPAPAPVARAVPTQKVAMLERRQLRDTSLEDLLRGAGGGAGVQ